MMTEADKERAAIVDWLHEDAREWKATGGNLVACMAIHKAADAIERGDHLAQQEGE